MFSPESDSFEYSVEGLLGCTPLIWVKPEHNVRLKFITNKQYWYGQRAVLFHFGDTESTKLVEFQRANAEILYLNKHFTIKFI